MSMIKKRRGAVLQLMAVLLPVIITVVGFATNLAYMESVRTDFQIASDADDDDDAPPPPPDDDAPPLPPPPTR
jgi:hypothetical protein